MHIGISNMATPAYYDVKSAVMAINIPCLPCYILLLSKIYVCYSRLYINSQYYIRQPEVLSKANTCKGTFPKWNLGSDVTNSADVLKHISNQCDSLHSYLQTSHRIASKSLSMRCRTHYFVRAKANRQFGVTAN